MAFKDEARMLAMWIKDDGTLASKSQMTHGIYYLDRTDQYYHYHKGQASPSDYSEALYEIFQAMYLYDFIDIDLEILKLVRKKYRDLESLDEIRKEKVIENLEKFEDY